MSDLAVNESLVHTRTEVGVIDSVQISSQLHVLVRGEPTPFVWALTLTAGISGLLFGYE